jgi:two-component system sensor histidine kinase KdpD
VRILLYLTSDPSTAGLIRRAKRVADYLHAQCFAVYLTTELPLAERKHLELHISFAKNLHIETSPLSGTDVPKVLAEFARDNKITQLFLCRSTRDRERIIQSAKDLEITVVADRRR